MKTRIILVVSILATLISCSENKNNPVEHDAHEEHEGAAGVVTLSEQQREALDLQLGTFQMRNITTKVKTNGQLEVPPENSADVTAVIGGNVKEIKVFHGDKVAKGQVLAILEHPDYVVLQENFAEVANNLEFLEQEYNRQKELFENNVGAGKDFQQAKAQFNVAKAKYEGLKSRLRLLNLSPENVKNGKISNTISITAPIKGYVNEVNIKVGTYVDAKGSLFGITDNSEIHADFMVYENDVHLLQEGQKIHFTVSNLPGEELLANIFAIGKEFERNTRAVHIHAKLQDNPGNLVPGMYVSGHIHTDENYTRTLPNDAIVNEGAKSYIFILDETAEAVAQAHQHDEGEIHVESNEEHAGEAASEHESSNREAFRMVEVVTGKQDEGYTEIKLLASLPGDTKVVMNAAYYLLSDLNKGETEHEH